MENRLKERLTGAAILVALIVLLVPEMFRGQRAEVAATAGSSGDGAPVRSYTIDLSNGPARTGPLQSTSVGGASEVAAAAPTPAPPMPAPPIPAPPTPVLLAPAPAIAPPAAVPPVSTARTTASQGGWSVQLGLFAKRENAERLMHAAQAKGFTVGISNADTKGLYHVHVAGLPDRTAAQTLSLRLKADGFSVAVVAPP
jgi:DedD protein